MKSKEINNWCDEHGESNFSYLEFFNRNYYIKAIEKLQEKFSNISIDFNKTRCIEELKHEK